MGSAPWRLSGYRVVRLLGAGASSEVWLGTVRATGAHVALKRIRLTDPAQRAAAVSEAAVLGALDHPNLIRLHRLERVDDAIVLVLDYACAGTLGELLGARGRLTPGEAITALSPIAAALAHAHAAGVVHGDVTPANVLFSDNGLSLLADLGVARLVGDTKPVHTTLPYADPIVAAGCLPEQSSDVFMLGGVALHTVTGHPPPSAAGELDPIAWQARISARLATAQVPRELAAVLTRALSLEPRLRGSAADLALDLRHAGTPVAVELTAGRARTEPSLARLAAIAAGRPATDVADVHPGAPPLTHGVRLPSPMPAARHRARRRSLLLPSAVLVAAAAVVTGALLWWPSSTEPTSRAAAPPAAARPAIAVPARSTAAPAAPTSDPLDVPAALTVLTRLDVARAQAFAARDPQRLAQVYRSSVLLARDRAALSSLVPPGCGLRGVRTSYARLRIVRADRSSVSLTATATLARSQLVCGGVAAGRAAGSGPAELAITLTRAASGWRVVGLHPAAG